MKPRDRLYQVAYRQQGYFTARQAALAGYADSAPAYHIAAGNWIREDRGIYRLAHFPNHPDSDAMVCWLWTSNREGRPLGVLSHQSALDLHDLCDINPRKWHMTVPKGFRRAVIPGTLVLHKESLGDEDITSYSGLPITTLFRTLYDLIWEQSVAPEQLVMAIDTALKRGLLDKKTLAKLRNALHPNSKFIDFLLESLEHGDQALQEAL
ncbi:MAG: type IV toxin-antitoxin system AbiEi family antitoxin domain-containing protein [Parachlamydiales bacterium]